jgi:putative ABC transport system ATP-binding protein
MSVVELIAVTKVYTLPRGSLTALDQVSMSIGAGDFVSIMGPSGSGKSTLLNIIGCLDTPTSGKVVIGDEDVSALTDEELTRIRRDKIGFVFQQFNLIQTLTAVENIAYPLRLKGLNGHEARSKELMRSVGLSDDLSENKPSELSGGEQQRVAIARALANEPETILADEPTGNLDTKTSRAIMELLREMNERGTTIIVVTHDPVVAAYTRKTFRLVDGRIASIESAT